MKVLIDKYFSLIRRFIPEKDQQTTIGLDISQETCRFVELVDFGDYYELVRWGVFPIKQDNFAEALSFIVEGKEKKVVDINTAVFGKGTLIRYIDMPRMSAGDLKKSIELEADKYFPFDPDSVYLDFVILDVKSKDAMMSVLVAAVKRDMVDERVRVLSECNMNTKSLSLNAVAHINAFDVFPPMPKEERDEMTCALIDVGETVTNLVIIDKGVPRFTRDIYIGSHDFSRRIMNALDVDFDEAQKLKESPGAKKKAVQQACESILINLFAEIRLSLDYFVTEKNIQVKKIYLMGDGALTTGIDDAFQEQFDIPLEMWSALSQIKVSDSIAAEDITQYALKLNTAIGLALEHD